MFCVYGVHVVVLVLLFSVSVFSCLLRVYLCDVRLCCCFGLCLCVFVYCMYAGQVSVFSLWRFLCLLVLCFLYVVMYVCCVLCVWCCCLPSCLLCFDLCACCAFAFRVGLMCVAPCVSAVRCCFLMCVCVMPLFACICVIRFLVSVVLCSYVRFWFGF